MRGLTRPWTAALDTRRPSERSRPGAVLPGSQLLRSLAPVLRSRPGAVRPPSGLAHGGPAALPARRRPESGPPCQPPPGSPYRQPGHDRMDGDRDRSEQPHHQRRSDGDNAQADPGDPGRAPVAEPPEPSAAARERQLAGRQHEQGRGRHNRGRYPHTGHFAAAQPARRRLRSASLRKPPPRDPDRQADRNGADRDRPEQSGRQRHRHRRRAVRDARGSGAAPTSERERRAAGYERDQPRHQPPPATASGPNRAAVSGPGPRSGGATIPAGSGSSAGARNP